MTRRRGSVLYIIMLNCAFLDIIGTRVCLEMLRVNNGSKVWSVNFVSSPLNTVSCYCLLMFFPHIDMIHVVRSLTLLS